MTSRFDGLNLWRVFGFCALVLVPFTLFSRHSATSLYIFMGITTIFLKYPRNLPLKGSLGPLGLSSLLFVLWAGLTSVWSIDSWLSFGSTLRLLLVMAIGVWVLQWVQNLEKKQCDFISAGLVIGVFTGLMILALVAFNELFIHDLFITQCLDNRAVNHATSLIAILVWPACYFLNQIKKGFLSVLGIVSSIIIIFCLDSETAKIAVVLGMITALLSYFHTHQWIRILRAGTCVLMLIAPLLPLTVLAPEKIVTVLEGWHIKSSFSHRLYIWAHISELIAKHPFKGEGMNTSSTYYHAIIKENKEAFKEFTSGEEKKWAQLDLKVLGTALHPHNATLQIWLELGLPGILVAITIIWIIFQAISRMQDKFAQQTALTTLAAALTLSHSSYGLWQTWWITALWMSGIITSIALRYGRVA